MRSGGNSPKWTAELALCSYRDYEKLAKKMRSRADIPEIIKIGLSFYSILLAFCESPQVQIGGSFEMRLRRDEREETIEIQIR